MLLPQNQLFSAPGLSYNLGSSATTTSSITVSFAGGIGALSYEYQISTTADLAVATAWTALATSLVISGLSTATAYFFRLRGVRGMTRGPVSGFGTATTNGAGTTGEPLGLLLAITKAS